MKNETARIHSSRKVVRVTRTEFELDDGSVNVIEPPLEHDETPEEFQRHYDRALEAMRCLQGAGHHHADAQGVGPGRQDQDDQD